MAFEDKYLKSTQVLPTVKTNMASKYLPETPEGFSVSNDLPTHADGFSAENTNRYGLGGGVAYTMGKVGTGFLSGVEGIWDYTAGGLAKLFGADDWAEQQFNTDWIDYNALDEWYNPNGVMKTVGDVASGIGTSLPAIGATAGAAAIAVFSGGTLSPVAAGIISGTVAGLGAAGNATKEAYRETGELGAEEFGYGALSGATEAALEFVSTGIGAGTGAMATRVAKGLGKDITGSIVRETAIKTIAKDFASEAFEEGVGEFLDPYYKRLTYDENAKNASVQEIAYSALVGGLSGAIMSGVGEGYSATRNIYLGNQIVNNGRTQEVLSLSKKISDHESEYKTESEAFAYVKEKYDEYMKGNKSDLRSRVLLAEMQRGNTAAVFDDIVVNGALDIIQNAEVYAERLSSLGYIDENGNTINVTAKELTKGITVASGREYESQVRKALKENEVLRALAVSSATGKIIMDSAQFRNNVLKGKQLSSQADLNRFLEQTVEGDEYRTAVSNALGIENLANISADEFNDKMTAFVESGGIEREKNRSDIIKTIESVAEAETSLPEGANKVNGVKRYVAQGVDFAVYRDGKTYRIYDYQRKTLSKELTKTEANRAINQIRSNVEDYVKQTEEIKQKTARKAAENAEVERYARSNVKDYNGLNATRQSEIRSLIRRCREKGVNEETTKAIANISAHSGVNIRFTDIENGYYSMSKKTIYVNPNGSRTIESTLIHELTHAIDKTRDGRLVLMKGVEKMSSEEKEKIRKRYADFYEKHGDGLTAEVYYDELNAHYAEAQLTNKNFLERIVLETPSFVDKIKNFFTGAKEYYSEDKVLSRSVRSLERSYKAMFDEFSRQNKNTKNQEFTLLSDTRFKLEGYTQHEVDNWKNSKKIEVYKNNAQFMKFIESSVTNKTFSKKLYFGKVDGKLANRIKEKTGLMLDGYNIAIHSYEIRKLFKSHGTEEEILRGQKQIIDTDLYDIPDVIQNNTDIIYDSDDKYEGKPVITFVQEKGNKKSKIMTYVSKKSLDIRVHTEYIHEKKGSLTTTSDVLASDLTSETTRGTKPFDNSIRNDKEKVNTKTQEKTRFSIKDESLIKKYQSLDLNKDISKMDGVPAIRLIDGSVLPFTENHIEYIKKNDIDVDDIESGGWVANGEYEATERSDTLRYKEQQLAKRRMLEKRSKGVRFSLKETVEEDVVKHYGKTYRWSETGYILKDGTRLDLSGRSEGASGGYRTVDHRDIFDIYEDGDVYGTEAMIEFISRGNIRVMPEAPGINLSVEPNEEQYRLIQDLIERLGFKERYFSVDFDNEYGDTIDNLTYDGRVSGRRVVADIKYFFKEGKVPKGNDVLYSLKDSEGRTLTQEQLDLKDNRLALSGQTDAEKILTETLGIGVLAKNRLNEKDGLVPGEKNLLYARLNFDLLSRKSVDRQDSYLKTKIKNVDEAIYAENALLKREKNEDEALRIKKSIEALEFYKGLLNAEKESIELSDAPYIRNAEAADRLNKIFATDKTAKRVAEYFEKNMQSVWGSAKNNDLQSNAKQGAKMQSDKKETKERKVGKMVERKSINKKAYSEKEAKSAIQAIVADELNLGDEYGELSKKSLAQATERLYVMLNTKKIGERGGEAGRIADFLLDNIVLRQISENDSAVQDAVATISLLKKYMHNIKLNGIKDEITYRFDKKNSVNLIWGSQNGISPDVVAQELREEGLPLAEGTAADEFFEIVDRYQEAKTVINEAKAKRSLSDDEKKSLKAKVVSEILGAYDKYGTTSETELIVEAAKIRVKELLAREKEYANDILAMSRENEELRNVNEAFKRGSKTQSKWIEELEADVQMKNINSDLSFDIAYLRTAATKGKYVSSDVLQSEEVRTWIKELTSGMLYKGNVRSGYKVRDQFASIGKWYNVKNEMLNPGGLETSKIAPQEDNGYLDENVLNAIADLNTRVGAQQDLTLQDLEDMSIIVKAIKKLFKEYDTAFIAGKSQKITDYVTKKIERQEANNPGKKKTGILGYVSNGIANLLRKAVEPSTVIKAIEGIDGYEGTGALTECFNDVKKGVTMTNAMYIGMREEMDEFFLKNRNFQNKLKNKMVDIHGEKVPIGLAIYLYELSKRPQAQSGLMGAGVKYKDGSDNTIVLKFAENEDITTMLADMFDETEKEYISIVEKYFNQTSKNAKTEADAKILGYTNVSDDFYIPIVRDKMSIARNIADPRSAMRALQVFDNYSFNKNVKENASNMLMLEDIDEIFDNHARLLSIYANQTIPLRNLARVYTKNIGTKTDVRSLRQHYNDNIWSGTEGYLTKLLSDIQENQKGGNMLIAKIRSAYAQYQLGGNVKVVLSQFTSLPMAGTVIKDKHLFKGAFMPNDFKGMDEYCPYAEARAYSSTVAKGEGVMNKISKVGEIMMKPISWMDRFTISRMWNAAKLQIAEEYNTEYDSVETKQKAGELLEKAIRETQPTYDQTDRSELMRSESEIIKSFTMFSSVAVKQLSRLYDGVGSFLAYNRGMKDSGKTAEMKIGYKRAQRQLVSVVAHITAANVAYTLVGLLVNALLAKEEKDKEGNEIPLNQQFSTNLIGNTIGMFPIVKDIYGYFSNGYDFSNFTYDMANDVLSSTKDLYNLVADVCQGEQVSNADIFGRLKASVYAAGEMTGVPTRNLYNLVYGIVKRFSPSVAYKMGSIFYNENYSKDLKRAIENGDESLSNTIMALLLNDKTGVQTENVRKETLRLYEKGYDVLPKGIGATIKVNGEEIDVSAKQKSHFNEVYSKANVAIEEMLKNSYYSCLNDSEKGKAINYVHSAYYAAALSDISGGDNMKELLSRYIAIPSLATAMAKISSVESEKDKDGKTIAGSKKRKVLNYLKSRKDLTDKQKMFLLMYNGYSIGDGEFLYYTKRKSKEEVLRYIINNNDLTSEQKAGIAKKCGFEVQNGKIVKNSIYT